MSPSLSPFTFVRAVCAMLLLTVTAFGAPKGVIIYKEQAWLTDEFAEAVEYDELEEFASIIHITTQQNEKIALLTGKLVKSIRYLTPDELREIIEPQDVAKVSTSINDLTAAARQYPKAAKILAPRIRLLQDIVTRFQKGEAVFDGVWRPSKEAALKLKKDREAALAAADAEDQRLMEASRIAKEKKLAEEKQKKLDQVRMVEKELVRKRLEAKAAAEQARLQQEAEAAEAAKKVEEQRIAEEKAATEKRQIEYAAKKMHDANRFTEAFDQPVSLETAKVVPAH